MIDSLWFALCIVHLQWRFVLLVLLFSSSLLCIYTKKLVALYLCVPYALCSYSRGIGVGEAVIYIFFFC